MCGLFGFVDYRHKLSAAQIHSLVENLATESAVRGTDATGVAYNHDGKLKIQKDDKSAYKMDFRIPVQTRALIGHTRHATQGSCKKSQNNHPFQGKLTAGNLFALAHNGIICNDIELRKIHALPKTKVETDSYIAVQLLEREQALTFDSMQTMAEAVSGSYTFALLDQQDNTYLIKGDNPLAILHFKEEQFIVYASTEEILWRALSSSMLPQLKAGQFEEVSINEGTILKISPNGQLTYGAFQYRSSYLSRSYNWWEVHETSGMIHTDYDDYLEELKSMASIFGYTPEDIDYMREALGYTLDEIEDLLYCEEEQYALMNR